MIVALNVGSSSLKFSAFDKSDLDTTLSTGMISRIGQQDSVAMFELGGAQTVEGLEVPTHEAAATMILDWLNPLISREPNVVLAHRVVHGGRMTAHAEIDQAIERAIEDASHLAPLHNPPALGVIRRTRDVMGSETQMIAVFDTAFFAGLPEVAFRYAIPWDLSERYGIRRYGFHGLAHQCLTNASAQTLHQTPDETTVITLQLGSGCSAALVVKGYAIDTSMGITPLEGLMMGTRSGSIDPAIVGMLADGEGISTAAAIDILNFESGLKGVSGVSADWRDVEMAAANGDERATVATGMFSYRIRKQVGAYMAAAPGHVDAIVFGGGIGEHSSALRSMAVGRLGHLGVELDEQRNQAPSVGQTRVVSGSDSLTSVLVTHVDEMRGVAAVASELAGPRI